MEHLGFLTFFLKQRCIVHLWTELPPGELAGGRLQLHLVLHSLLKLCGWSGKKFEVQPSNEAQSGLAARPKRGQSCWLRSFAAFFELQLSLCREGINKATVYKAPVCWWKQGVLLCLLCNYESQFLYLQKSEEIGKNKIQQHFLSCQKVFNCRHYYVLGLGGILEDRALQLQVSPKIWRYSH